MQFVCEAQQEFLTDLSAAVKLAAAFLKNRTRDANVIEDFASDLRLAALRFTGGAFRPYILQQAKFVRSNRNRKRNYDNAIIGGTMPEQPAYNPTSTIPPEFTTTESEFVRLKLDGLNREAVMELMGISRVDYDNLAETIREKLS